MINHDAVTRWNTEHNNSFPGVSLIYQPTDAPGPFFS
jgi:hypothetical protein